MTTLQKLRSHQVWLVGLILFALFAFILGEVISSRERLFAGDRAIVGEVGDDVLKIDEYRTQTNQVLEQNKNRGVNYSTAANMVWRRWVDNAVWNQRLEKSGIKAGEEAILNTIAKFPQIQQYFGNALGEVDINNVLQWAKVTREEKDKQNPQAIEQWQFWEEIKRTAKENYTRQFYFDMVNASVSNITKLDAEVEHFIQQSQIDAEIAYLPFSSVADDSIVIPDKEIEDYVKKHKDDFKKKESRDLQYVIIPITASLEDKNETLEKVKSYLEDKVEFNKRSGKNETVYGLKNTKEVEAFVNSVSDPGFRYNQMFYHSIPNEELNSWAMKASVGDVSPIVEDGNTYKVARLMETAIIPDSVKVSHALISYQGASINVASRTREEAKKLVDSLYSSLKSGKTNFSSIVKNNSDDPDTKMTEGQIGWFKPLGGLPELERFIFSSTKGATKVIETPAGYHIFKIDETTPAKKAVRIALISNEVIPSKQTTADILNKAQKLASSNSSVEEFVAKSKTEGYAVNPVEGLTILDSSLPGLAQDQHQVIRWAFSDERKLSDVEIFDIPGAHLVVAVSGVETNGLENIEKARFKVEPILKKEKKADILKSKISTSKASSIEQVVEKTNAEKLSAISVTLSNPTIAGAGSEPKVVGVLFGIKENSLSEPIVGENGVFVVTKTASREASKQEDTSFYKQIIALGQQNMMSYFFQALEKSADLKDNREYIEKF